MTIRPARAEEHKKILEISKLSKYTKDFSNQVMFSSPAAYEKNWILVAEDQGEIIGFICFRVKMRKPETTLYFVGVREKRRGVGWALIMEMMRYAGDNLTLTLNCAKDNDIGNAFYARHGFEVTGESLKGTGYALRRVFTRKELE